MYTIKQTPQDFIVDEIIDLSKISPQPKPNLKFHIYKLTKQNNSTLFCLSKIAQRLEIDEKQIGFCGLKDKNATTSQYISIPSFGTKTSQERVESLSTDSYQLKYVGSTNVPLFIGSLQANHFTIKVTDIEDFEINPQQTMINYFGEQRFSDQNEEVGRLLITKRFAQARDLIIDECISKNDRDIEAMKKFKELRPNDAVGALKRLNPQLLKLYTHAFQSAIWNKMASQIASDTNFNVSTYHFDKTLNINIPHNLSKEKLEQVKLPLLGFDYEEDEYDATIKALVKQELAQEKLTLRDFICKEFPEITKSGGSRLITSPINDLEIMEQINPSTNSREAVISFTLDKGSYATIALRHILIPKTKK